MVSIDVQDASRLDSKWCRLPLLLYRKRGGHTEVQEETSCRGFGGVPQITQCGPKNGGSRGLKEGSETACRTQPGDERVFGGRIRTHAGPEKRV